MAPRDDDKAMDGLLRRSLMRDVAPGDCPAPDVLAAYQEGSLEGEELARHELHFSRCARCREQLVAMARARAEVEVPALALTAAAKAASPAIAAADSRDDRTHPRRRIWLLDWRFLAPVAAVLAITAVLYTQLAHRAEKPVAFHNEIAMSKTEPQPAPQPPTAIPEARLSEPAATPSTRNALGAAHGASREKPAKKVPSPSSTTNRDQALFAENAAGVAGTPTTPAAPLPKNSVSSRKTYSASTGGVGGAFMGGSAAGSGAGTTSAGRMRPAPPAAPSAAAASPSAQQTPPPAAADITSVTVEAPPAAEAQKANAKPAATTQSVTVQAEAPAVETAPGNKPAPAAEHAKIQMPVEGRAFQQLTKVETREKIIKTPDSAVMYRIAEAGFVERTQDNGATWQGQQVDPTAEIIAGSAPAAKICWLVGRNGVIYLTKDGTNWTKIRLPAQVDFVQVAATSASSATVTAADGRKFSTRNGGKTWTLVQ
jgi:hypothetical protein